MLEEWAISMNRLEKNSFYSFLALYISSSFFFVLLSGFWYYKAQENALSSKTYYKLQHYADRISGLIINAQMHDTALILPTLEDGYSYELIKNDEKKAFPKKYFKTDKYNVLVSDATQEHLHVKFVVVKTNEYARELKKLQFAILLWMLMIFIVIVVISFFLAKLFMKPIHQKVVQIESFIQDISHELNTPITALQMSSKRAMQKGAYDEKIITNISISTKQLYALYKSLAYLSFSGEKKEIHEINLKDAIKEVIEFYGELCTAKNITIKTELDDRYLKIDNDKAKLLISNLFSNAIKYSMPNTTITITLKKNFFSIKDEGIGIAKEKIRNIFELYKRASSVAGGFGVGLSIVKQICDEHNIKINVNSKINEGSIFTLSFN